MEIIKIIELFLPFELANIINEYQNEIIIIYNYQRAISSFIYVGYDIENIFFKYDVNKDIIRYNPKKNLFTKCHFKNYIIFKKQKEIIRTAYYKGKNCYLFENEIIILKNNLVDLAIPLLGFLINEKIIDMKMNKNSCYILVASKSLHIYNIISGQYVKTIDNITEICIISDYSVILRSINNELYEYNDNKLITKQNLLSQQLSNKCCAIIIICNVLCEITIREFSINFKMISTETKKTLNTETLYLLLFNKKSDIRQIININQHIFIITKEMLYIFEIK
jgi:hypothetical protein